MKLTLIALAGSFIIIMPLLLIIIGFPHVLAFRPQILQLQSLSFLLPIQFTQQQQSSSEQQGILGLVAPEQQSSAAQSPPIPKQGSIEGVTTNGTINSLIYAPTTTWIATGQWNLGVNNGTVALFTTNMTWYNSNGTAIHTHEFRNFRSTEGVQPIIVQPDKSLFLRGVMDVGTNNRIVWKNVQSTISIKGGKAISILVNDAQTNLHFAGQPVFGVITSFTLCSDVPLPNMVVLPPCLDTIPSLPPPQVAAITTTFASPTTATTNAGEQQLQSPTFTNPSNMTTTINPNTIINNATGGGEVLQSPIFTNQSSQSGNNITIATPTPTTNNQPGKSPFDILGGSD